MPSMAQSENEFNGAVAPHQAGTSAHGKIPDIPTIDFVIPLKSVGAITRAVIESVFKHYAARAIYIICPTEEISVLTMLSDKWDIPEGLLHYVDEESFFVKKFGMMQKEFEEFFDTSRDKSKMREFGWWWQQLLKLGAAHTIPELSDTFYVWDGDLIVLDAWPLVTHSPEGPAYHVAILQEKARSEFYKAEYEASVRTLLGMETSYPEEGGTHVSHHMPINKTVVGEMIDLIDSRLPGSEPWPAKILRTSSLHFRMSEYMLYATFILEQQKACNFKHFRTHRYLAYGKRAIRIRDSKAIVDELVAHHGVEWLGYSLQQITSHLDIHPMNDLQSNDLEVGMKPSCLQIEHVYDIKSGNPFLNEAALTGDADVQYHRK